MNQYEAMFLFDPTFGSAFENCESEIRRLMDRAEAEIVFLGTWDERRLAYKIKGRKRGVYVLVFFKAGSDKIAHLERDVQLSENVLRVLVLRADGVTLDVMEKAVSSHGAASDEDAGEVVQVKGRTSKEDKPAPKEDKPAPKEEKPAPKEADVPAGRVDESITTEVAASDTFVEDSTSEAETEAT